MLELLQCAREGVGRIKVGEGGVGETVFLEHVAMVVNHAVCSTDIPFQAVALELVRLDDRTGKLREQG